MGGGGGQEPAADRLRALLRFQVTLMGPGGAWTGNLDREPSLRDPDPTAPRSPSRQGSSAPPSLYTPGIRERRRVGACTANCPGGNATGTTLHGVGGQKRRPAMEERARRLCHGEATPLRHRGGRPGRHISPARRLAERGTRRENTVPGTTPHFQNYTTARANVVPTGPTPRGKTRSALSPATRENFSDCESHPGGTALPTKRPFPEAGWAQPSAGRREFTSNARERSVQLAGRICRLAP